MLWSSPRTDYRDDELGLVDDDPELDLLNDLDEWVADCRATTALRHT